MRPDVKVRMAQDDDVKAVQGLLDEIVDIGGWRPTLDKIFPYWLVAEMAGEIVGIINLRISMPFSSVELLSIDSRVTQRERGEILLMLTDSAMAIAASAGSQAVTSMIPDEMESYLKVAQHRGYQSVGKGTIVLGRIR